GGGRSPAGGGGRPPPRRYQSARELREDLERQLASRPLRHAADPSWRERAGKWVRRHPRLSSWTTLGALAGVAVLLLAAWGAWQWQARQTLEATDSQHQLQQDLPAIQALLTQPGAVVSQSEEGVALCRKHAERYGVLQSPAWQDGPLVRRLDDKDQARLREDMGEVLLSWARVLGRQAAQAGPSADRDE